MTDLEVGQISQDLVVLLVHAQRILVALDGLIIVQVRSVDQPAVHKHLEKSCQSLTLISTFGRSMHVCHIHIARLDRHKQIRACTLQAIFNEDSSEVLFLGVLPKHMPCDMTLEVVLDALLGQIIGFLLLG